MADRGPNTTSAPGGVYQDLDTGLHYDVHTNEVVEQKDNTGKPVLQEDQIGAYKRVVHTDGSVATFQTEPASNPSEIQTPVPLPGETSYEDVKAASAAPVTKAKGK